MAQSTFVRVYARFPNPERICGTSLSKNLSKLTSEGKVGLCRTKSSSSLNAGNAREGDKVGYCGENEGKGCNEKWTWRKDWQIDRSGKRKGEAFIWTGKNWREGSGVRGKRIARHSNMVRRKGTRRGETAKKAKRKKSGGRVEGWGEWEEHRYRAIEGNVSRCRVRREWAGPPDLQCRCNLEATFILQWSKVYYGCPRISLKRESTMI